MHFTVNSFPFRNSTLVVVSPQLNYQQSIENTMISVLAQERLLGAALGSIFSGVMIFEHRRMIYQSISQTQPQPREPIFGRKSRREFAHIWNRAVDKTFGPLIESLSSRGW